MNREVWKVEWHGLNPGAAGEHQTLAIAAAFIPAVNIVYDTEGPENRRKVNLDMVSPDRVVVTVAGQRHHYELTRWDIRAT